MKAVLTPSEAVALDTETQARGVAADTLMERAGFELARVASTMAAGRYGKRAVVVCGKGNNGGDGLVAARHLDRSGLRTTVMLLEPVGSLREPAARNARSLEGTGVRVRELSEEGLARELGRADVAIDAIFGTGFRGRPEGGSALAIRQLNAAGAPIVAADIPSGVNGESAIVEGEAVWADVTVTFGALKAGIVLLPGVERAGVIEIADIGFPEEILRPDLWLVERDDVAAVLPRREPDTHKRASGVVVVIGGSRLMTGAVCLAAEAAYRAGAGLVTVAVPESILPIVQSVIREATFVGLPETDEGAVADGSDRLWDVVSAADAVAVGPGMTTDARTAKWIRTLVRSCSTPMVLDADGLNAFAGRAADLADRRADVVLTPHEGEFARLSGMDARDVDADRVGNARKLAAETNGTLLLKGSRTLVASPEGRVTVNPTGGSFLATAGSGDVLTGTIAGLRARGLTSADSAMAGAYVHGLAGSRAARDAGEGTSAGDVLAHLAAAVNEVRTA